MSCAKLSGLKRLVSHDTPFGRQIRGVAAERYKKREAEKREGPKMIVTFASRRMNHINVRNELLLHKADFPFAPSLLHNVRIVYKPRMPTGFRNHVDASIDAFKLPTTCFCEQVDPKFKVGGHVLTADVDVLSPLLDERHRDAIKWLITNAGPRYRSDLSVVQTLLSIRADLESFIASCELSDPEKKCTNEEKTLWVERMCESLAHTFYAHRHEKLKSPLNGMNVTKVLQAAHERYVFAPADKNAQNTVIWCKALYRDNISSHLSPPVYEEVSSQRTFEELIEDHRAVANTYGKAGYDTLPYLYKLAKIHKLEQCRDGAPPTRPICGKSRKSKPGEPSQFANVNSLSDVHRQVAAMLSSVMDLLVLRDQRSKIRYCWFVRTTQEVIDTVCSDSTIEEFETSDFSDMYTNIPLDDLVTELHAAIELAADELARLFNVTLVDAREVLRFTPMRKWERPSGRAVASHWSLHTLKNVLERIVYMSYVRVGDRLFRQTRGIGMGPESSPPIANLYLHMKERKWIDKKLCAEGEEFIQRRYNNFRSFVRQMDDNLFPIDRSSREYGALPEVEDYGGLQFNVTGSGQMVKFIGLQFKTEPRGTHQQRTHEVSVKAYDKQESFAFTLIRYPTWHSNVPRHIITGCIVGMLVRFLRLTSKTQDFVVQAVAGLKRMCEFRQYPTHAVKSGVAKFVKRNIEPRFVEMVKDRLFEVLQPPVVEAASPVATSDADQAPVPPGAQAPSPAEGTNAEVFELIINALEPETAENQLERNPSTIRIEDLSAQSAHGTRRSRRKKQIVRPPYQTRGVTTRALARSVGQLANHVQRLSEARASSLPASSAVTPSTNQTVPAIDQDAIRRSLREVIHEQSSASSRTDEVLAQAVANVSESAKQSSQIVERLCDTLSRQSDRHASDLAAVVAVRPPDNNNVASLQLLEDLRKESSEFKEFAKSFLLSVMRKGESETAPPMIDGVLSKLQAIAESQHQQAQALLMSSAAAQSGLTQSVELLGNRLADSTRLALAPPPPPVIHLGAPAINVQPLVQVNSPSDNPRIFEFMATLFAQQREMMAHFHASVEGIAIASREQSKHLLEQSVSQQGLLLSKFSESVAGMMQSNASPTLMLLPVLRQCITGLAQTRESISTIQRSSLMLLESCERSEGSVRAESPEPAVRMENAGVEEARRSKTRVSRARSEAAEPVAVAPRVQEDDAPQDTADRA